MTGLNTDNAGRLLATIGLEWPGNPNGHVLPSFKGCLCIDTLTPGLYQAESLSSSSWVAFGGGGGGGGFDYTGSGSPEGVQTSTGKGKTYGDLTNGGSYVFAGTADTDTGWVLVGGGAPGPLPLNTPGFGIDESDAALTAQMTAAVPYFVVGDSTSATALLVSDSTLTGNGPSVITAENTLDDGQGNATLVAGLTLPGLPDSDPGSDGVWLDSGVLTIGAGGGGGGGLPSWFLTSSTTGSHGPPINTVTPDSAEIPYLYWDDTAGSGLWITPPAADAESWIGLGRLDSTPAPGLSFAGGAIPFLSTSASTYATFAQILGNDGAFWELMLSANSASHAALQSWFDDDTVSTTILSHGNPNTLGIGGGSTQLCIDVADASTGLWMWDADNSQWDPLGAPPLPPTGRVLTAGVYTFEAGVDIVAADLLIANAADLTAYRDSNTFPPSGISMQGLEWVTNSPDPWTLITEGAGGLIIEDNGGGGFSLSTDGSIVFTGGSGAIQFSGAGGISIQDNNSSNGISIIEDSADGGIFIHPGTGGLFIEGLPTSDPGSPGVWLDSGVLTIGAGGGGGGGAMIGVNNGQLVSSGVLPLQVTQQPLVLTTGIPQPLPPAFGLVFPNTPITFPSGSTSPTSIITGPDGNLYYCDTAGGNIIQMTTTGATTVIALDADARPSAICISNEGQLYVADGNNTSAPTIWVVDLTALTATPTVVTGGYDITTICAGNDPGDSNFVWCGTATAEKVVKFPLGSLGVSTAYALPSGASITGICAGPDGAMWLADTGNHHIIQVTSAGTVTSHSLSSSGTLGPICVGADTLLYVVGVGHVWAFTPWVPGESNRFDLAGTNASGIVAGPDGYLWMGDGGGIWRLQPGPFIINPTAVLYECGSEPGPLCVGPNGSLWIIDTITNDILVQPFVMQVGGLTLASADGAGSPEGAVTGVFVGQEYIDGTNGGQYIFAGTPGEDTGWLTVGGRAASSAPLGVAGFSILGGPVAQLTESLTNFTIFDSAGGTAFQAVDLSDSSSTYSNVRTGGNTLDDGFGGAVFAATADSPNGFQLTNDSGTAGTTIDDNSPAGITINVNGGGFQVVVNGGGVDLIDNSDFQMTLEQEGSGGMLIDPGSGGLEIASLPLAIPSDPAEVWLDDNVMTIGVPGAPALIAFGSSGGLGVAGVSQVVGSLTSAIPIATPLDGSAPLVVVANNGTILAGSVGGQSYLGAATAVLWESVTNGAGWTNIPTPIDGDGEVAVIAIAFGASASEYVFVAAGGSGVVCYHTSDNGGTFNLLTTPIDGTAGGYVAYDGTNWYLTCGGTAVGGVGLWSSPDLSTWTPLTTGIDGEAVNLIWTDVTVLVVASAPGGALTNTMAVSGDGGTTWVNPASPFTEGVTGGVPDEAGHWLFWGGVAAGPTFFFAQSLDNVVTFGTQVDAPSNTLSSLCAAFRGQWTVTIGAVQGNTVSGYAIATAPVSDPLIFTPAGYVTPAASAPTFLIPVSAPS